MNYGLKASISIIASSVDLSNYSMSTREDTQSQVLHRWIGERYMHEIGTQRGSGNPIEYTSKDLRRAIAYLRIVNLIGAGVGREANVMRERVREVASWHTNGWVMVVDGEVFHTDDTDVIWYSIDHGHSYLIVPCWVGLL